MRRLQPMTPQEIAQLRRWTPEQMGQRVVRHADLQWSSRALLDAALPGCGAQMAPVIGFGLSQDRNHQAPIGNAHGFSIEWLKIPVGGQVSLHRLACKQVLTVHRGTMAIEVSNQALAPVDIEGNAIISIANGHVEGWDSFAMPANVWRRYRNIGDTEALLLLMTPGDGRKTIDWAPAVVSAAAAAGDAIDANGYLALKRFTDRSQR
jgi:mannose-6-phosphate isomerase-like protein (cupin superfamily)